MSFILFYIRTVRLNTFLSIIMNSTTMRLSTSGGGGSVPGSGASSPRDPGTPRARRRLNERHSLDFQRRRGPTPPGSGEATGAGVPAEVRISNRKSMRLSRPLRKSISVDSNSDKSGGGPPARERGVNSPRKSVSSAQIPVASVSTAQIVPVSLIYLIHSYD